MPVKKELAWNRRWKRAESGRDPGSVRIARKRPALGFSVRPGRIWPHDFWESDFLAGMACQTVLVRRDEFKIFREQQDA